MLSEPQFLLISAATVEEVPVKISNTGSTGSFFSFNQYERVTAIGVSLSFTSFCKDICECSKT